MNVYTKDESIKDVMRDAWIVICIFVFFDCMQGVANGAISGLGIVAEVNKYTLIRCVIIIDMRLILKIIITEFNNFNRISMYMSSKNTHYIRRLKNFFMKFKCCFSMTIFWPLRTSF